MQTTLVCELLFAGDAVSGLAPGWWLWWESSIDRDKRVRR